MKPELLFFHDDGHIPNSRFPVLIYRGAFPTVPGNCAELMEMYFAKNGWSNAWRSGIFTFHHYHSTAHEALGIYQGSTELQLGGEKGNLIAVSAGDILVLPAGTGHKNLKGENEVQAVGAYDQGRDYDILKGDVSDRPTAIDNIKLVPFPGADPLMGPTAGLRTIWKL
jgi:uncharacterized protein YjlB